MVLYPVPVQWVRRGVKILFCGYHFCISIIYVIYLLTTQSKLDNKNNDLVKVLLKNIVHGLLFRLLLLKSLWEEIEYWHLLISIKNAHLIWWFFLFRSHCCSKLTIVVIILNESKCLLVDRKLFSVSQWFMKNTNLLSERYNNWYHVSHTFPTWNDNT
jgi:hypothetical protein